MSEFAKSHCIQQFVQAACVRARGPQNCVGRLRAQVTVALSAACMMVCLLPSATRRDLPGQALVCLSGHTA